MARLVDRPHRFHQQHLPIELNRVRHPGRDRHFGDHPAFPVDDFVKRGQPFLARGSGVAHLAVLEINARLFPARAGELQHRGRAADALELNNIRNVQVTERALEAFAFARVGRSEQGLDQRHEIRARKRFLEKMNRAQTGHLLALRREMNRRQDNGASVGMTGAQVVDEFLRQIVGRIDIEDEEGRLLVDDELLRFA